MSTRYCSWVTVHYCISHFELVLKDSYDLLFGFIDSLTAGIGFRFTSYYDIPAPNVDVDSIIPKTADQWIQDLSSYRIPSLPFSAHRVFYPIVEKSFNAAISFISALYGIGVIMIITVLAPMTYSLISPFLPSM